MIQVYLAAPFELQAPMRGIREALKVYGIEMTSRWLDVKAGHHNELTESERAEWARSDLEDVVKADIFIAFNPITWHRQGTGGRHVELGYAIAHRIPIIYVGEERENLFHWHSLVKAQIYDPGHWFDPEAESYKTFAGVLGDVIHKTFYLFCAVRRASDR